MRLSPAQIATIEFQNDGVIDSLTATHAPAHFFQLLERESSIAERSGSALLLLSIRLDLEKYFEEVSKESETNRATNGGSKEDERFSPVEAVAKIERHIIAMAEALKSHLRAGDFFTRYSDTGYLVLIRGSQIEFHLVEKRMQEVIATVELLLDKKGVWKLASLIREKGEERLHLVERIDRIHF